MLGPMKTYQKTHQKTHIKNGQIVTMDKSRRVFHGDLLLEKGELSYVGKPTKTPTGFSVVDASDCLVIPGLIQAHTHLCQTLFRGYADDLALLDWLEKKIWPMEANHSAASLRASAEVGLLEMHLSGTTSINDMGTVRHTQALLETVEKSGMRYWGGKCLMDLKKYSGPLYEETQKSLKETEELIEAWASRSPLMQYSLCPRFAVSCTDEIIDAVIALQKERGLLIHTHASESKDEIALIKKRTGRNNVDYFADIGMLNKKTVLVHGVHLTKNEMNKMIKAKTALVHCPSSNLKLGSGIAPIETYSKEGMTIALGSDGAPCNNSMDPFIEMRLAALLQKPRFGPEAWPAEKALEMATLGGAKALGAEKEIGSLERGKRADVVVVSRTHPSVATVENPYSALVYSCLGRDVRDVFIDGEAVVRNHEHLIYESVKVLKTAKKELSSLLKRV